MSRPWRPAPFLKASVALHGAAAVGAAVVPGAWPWALGALVVNHAALTVSGLLPRSTWLGPNWVSLPSASAARREVALTIDDGPDPEVTPQVLDLLDEAGVRATFFCIGWRARQAPALCREIVARGHGVENHGDSHSNAFSLFGPKRMRADIAAAQATLADLTGQAPRFFRATAGLRNPLLEPVLAELDLQLAAWTRRPFDTVNADPERVLQRLTRDLGPGDILLMHDGHAAHTASGEPVILSTLPRLLQRLKQADLNPVTLQEAER
ncbi:polysaccharide deacetylase [Hydrogenophaga crassostreae]|uniref:Polysaccharide deacetylase n=1 Tax=Hydrogenophaga crassostreae TaxID=1763535 RepID=A0A167H006_9BURK|nr:polysaccharide deacetylase family protein [Hydrogenophaga crassostreae]AOW12894.1 polysaccharide deacetylase family protein [Hydrogenophaga crassostreae]OAD40080.1 polysaccharide deacetylase [Hydrogenophaga crassostreae]